MEKLPQQRRMFQGELYYLETMHETKPNAIKMQRAYKNKGYNARIVKNKNVGRYVLYAKKK